MDIARQAIKVQVVNTNTKRPHNMRGDISNGAIECSFTGPSLNLNTSYSFSTDAVVCDAIIKYRVTLFGILECYWAQ